MANVQHLFRANQRRLPMEEISEIRALENSGLEGCRACQDRKSASGVTNGQRDLGADGTAAGNHS